MPQQPKRPWKPQWKPQWKPGGGGGGGGQPGNKQGGGRPSGRGGGGQSGGGPRQQQGRTTEQIWNAGWDLGSPVEQARRDVNLFLAPQLQELQRLRGQVSDDYGEYGTQVGNLYGALGKELGRVGQGIDTDYGQLRGSFDQGVGNILGAIPQTSAPDQAAFNQMLQSQALAGSNELASAYQRMQNWNQGSAQQGNVEGMVMQRNIQGDLMDALEQINQERRDVLSNEGAMFKQRLDELRQLAFERMMGMKEYRLRAGAVASQMEGQKGMEKFMKSLLQDTGSGTWQGGGGGNWNAPGPGGGGGRPGGGGGGGGQPAGPRGARTVADLMAGETVFNQLAPAQMRSVRNYVRDRGGKLVNQLENVVPGGIDSNVSTADLMQMLRAYAKNQYQQGRTGGGGGKKRARG